MMKKNLISTAVALACLSLVGCNSLDGDDDNIAPVFDSGTSFDVDEGINTDTGYTALASDVNGDTVTYQISGSDAGQFSFDTSSGMLTFNETPDFEMPTDDNDDNVYKVVITATDGKNSFITQNVTITVGDIFENVAPVFSSTATASAAENSTATGYVALATDIDSDVITYRISGGADQMLFFIDSANGVLSFLQAADFEVAGDQDADNNYAIEVTANDGNGGVTSQAVIITVADVDESVNQLPVFVSATAASIQEGGVATGYTAAATDESSDTITYSISGGADSIVFTIDADTGVLDFVFAADFSAPADANGDNVYLLELSADAGAGAVTLNLALTVTQVAAQITLMHEVGFPTNNGNLGGTAMETSATGLITAESGVDLAHIDYVTVNGEVAILEDLGDAVRWSSTITTAVTSGTPIPINVIVTPSDMATVAETTLSVSVFNETLAITTLPRTTGVAYETATGKLYLTDRGSTHTLVDIDLATAEYTVISKTPYLNDALETVPGVGSGGEYTQPHDLVLAGNDIAYVVDFKAQLQDGKTKDKQLFKVDLTTGDRVAIGPTVRRMESVELFNGKLLVTAYDKNTIDGQEYQMGLYTIDINGTTDPMDDTLTPYSVSEDGTGEKFYRPQSLITNADDSEILVLDRKKFSLYKIDVNNNKARTVISGVEGSSDVEYGTGPSFQFPIDLAYLDDDNVYIIDDKLDALLLVNLISGDRIIISDASTGTGHNFDKPERITLDLERNRAFITDSVADILFVVDLATGNRVVVLDQAGLKL